MLFALSAWTAISVALALYADWRSPCGWTDTQQQAVCQAVQYSGLPSDFLPVFFSTTAMMDVFPWMLVGVFIFIRKSDRPFEFFFSLMLVVSGTFSLNADVKLTYLELHRPFPVMVVLADALLICWYCFPDGRFMPGWMRPIALLWVLLLLGVYFMPNSLLNFYNWPAPLPALMMIGFGASFVFVFIYRYRHVSNALQRQQIKWVVASGALLVLVDIVAAFLLPSISQVFNWPDSSQIILLLMTNPLIGLARSLIAISVVFSILRYRLWDIDFLINRSLVYGTLTLTVGILYLTSVSLLQAIFRTTTSEMSEIAIVLSTAFIAILFQPLRYSLQNGIDRSFYREKINFRQALETFTHEVRHYVELPELLQVIVYRITELFHSTCGALYLYRNGRFQLAEASNLPQTDRGLLPSASQLEQLRKGEVVTYKREPFDILVPLIALWVDRRELVGVLALGPKRSEATYGREDISQLSILIDEAGTAISLAQSVAEKRKAEQERESARQAAQLMSANHEAVLNNIADGVLVLDLQGDFLSANPALLAMIPQGDLQEIIAMPFDKNMHWKRKVFSVTTAPVPNVGTVAVFRDETRRIEIERAKDSMLATASHELRTPLTAVMNYLEMLIFFTGAGKVNSEVFAKYLNRALENSQRLHQLVLTILDHAQIRAGRIVLKKEPFNLPQLLDKTHQLFTSLIAQKSLSYELIIHADAPTIMIGDAGRLQQVLINLIGNAIKFTQGGSIQVTASCPDAEMLILTVADTGPGIPPEQLPDIFETFRRSSDYAQREHQGAGLGLSIVREIVTLMDGQISVSSEMGRGSVFTVIIPVVV